MARSGGEPGEITGDLMLESQKSVDLIFTYYTIYKLCNDYII